MSLLRLAISTFLLGCISVQAGFSAGYAGSPSPKASQSYGVISDSISKLEDTLEHGYPALSSSEYEYFLNKVESLKKSASLDLSGGRDASCYIQAVSSLQTELSLKLRDNASDSNEQKREARQALEDANQTLSERKDNLSKDEGDKFTQNLASLEKLVETNSSKDTIRALQDLRQSIIFASMAHPLGAVKEGGSGDGAAKTGASLLESASSDAPRSIHKGHLTETAVTGGGVIPHPSAPRKPMIAVPKLMHQLEDRLVELHDKNRLGTFDMDLYTSKLLAIKRNWQVMSSGSGILSARQESTLRQELDHLRQSIDDRISGAD